MNWFRYVFLALILVCAVSLLSLLAPDSKSSDRRFRIYIASVVAVGAIICVLFQALVPTSIESAGEKTEVAGTHSLASLKTESSLSGATALSFGYLTLTDEYVLMVKQDDGGYRRRCYPAKTVVVYEDTDAEDARVETVNSYEIVRLNYALPIVGEWSRDQLSFSRQETRIHVPQGSITQGEYDFSYCAGSVIGRFSKAVVRSPFFDVLLPPRSCIPVYIQLYYM